MKYTLIDNGPYTKSEANSKQNQLKLSDPEGYYNELNLMKDCHKVLIKNLDTRDRRTKNPDTNASDHMNEFINYNTVKDMIDTFIGPLAKVIPKVKADLSAVEKNMQLVQGQMKNV